MHGLIYTDFVGVHVMPFWKSIVVCGCTQIVFLVSFYSPFWRLSPFFNYEW